MQNPITEKGGQETCKNPLSTHQTQQQQNIQGEKPMHSFSTHQTRHNRRSTNIHYRTHTREWNDRYHGACSPEFYNNLNPDIIVVDETGRLNCANHLAAMGHCDIEQYMLISGRWWEDRGGGEHHSDSDSTHRQQWHGVATRITTATIW